MTVPKSRAEVLTARMLKMNVPKEYREWPRRVATGSSSNLTKFYTCVLFLSRKASAGFPAEVPLLYWCLTVGKHTPTCGDSGDVTSIIL